MTETFLLTAAAAFSLVFGLGPDSIPEPSEGMRQIQGQLQEGAEPGDVVDALGQLADGGDADALFALGLWHQRGVGVEPSLEKSVSFYRKAVEQGHLAATNNLGLLLVSRQVRNPELRAEGLELLADAIEQGSDGARRNLALLYASGAAVQRDHERARAMLKEGMEAGDAEAGVLLSQLWQGAHDHEKDVEKSMQLLRQAAEDGSTAAMNQLGACRS